MMNHATTMQAYVQVAGLTNKRIRHQVNDTHARNLLNYRPDSRVRIGLLRGQTEIILILWRVRR